MKTALYYGLATREGALPPRPLFTVAALICESQNICAPVREGRPSGEMKANNRVIKYYLKQTLRGRALWLPSAIIIVTLGLTWSILGIGYSQSDKAKLFEDFGALLYLVLTIMGLMWSLFSVTSVMRKNTMMKLPLMRMLLFLHSQGATVIPFGLAAALSVTGKLMKSGVDAIVSTTLGFVVAWMKMTLMLMAWNLMFGGSTADGSDIRHLSVFVRSRYNL